MKEPHGGELKNLYLNAEEAAEEKARSKDWPSWDLTPRQLCDIELILNGGFSPLEGFQGKADYDSVVSDMRLANGLLWPIPITMDVTQEFADTVSEGDVITLRDREGVLVATMTISDKWTPDKRAECEGVLGTTDDKHPEVDRLLNHSNPVYLGGKLKGVQAPRHFDFTHNRHSPQELRDLFAKWSWRKVVAFQTRNPLHRAHQELTFRAAREAEANLLLHPVVGLTKPGDIDYFTRVRCYEKLMAHYPDQTSALSLLPLAMRMAGPREAVWHGIIRKNYGCTHFIIGRDHAGPGKDSNGEDFYGPYDAQDLFVEHQEELDISLVPFKQMVYVQERAQYAPVDEVQSHETQLNISGTELRRRLKHNLELPDWFSFPEVVKVLRERHPPLTEQGFTLFFTGFSGSGKSTIANAVMTKLMEMGGRRVTLLDGDVVRKNLSSELGFSKEHRNLNIERIGYVASEITKNGGIAICAPIAPYSGSRRVVRELIEPLGGFLEIHVNTPLEVCEARDRKGLYAKARAGVIKEFTGISDPYEEPEDPEMRIDTTDITIDQAAQQVLLKLEKLGYLGA
ncbi:bifunctional sulfate adenylyltransferase/adenylylsulfate kinase [Parerythrobacter aestuarii]|uniref:bifunctional sulfate adenylyltransferase/adenylylsulfate kinase n=1 Tax=Parerythrobacter aestuarii TaxID=3020909 RepID=UPI0024DE3001|nr:bifunctional sulfate adenylyltransferase/adenylylsulfate kinase [Parerythrobacter aestuarii]